MFSKNNNFPAVGFGEFLKNLLLSSQLKFWKIELKVFMKVKMSKIVGHFKNFFFSHHMQLPEKKQQRKKNCDNCKDICGKSDKSWLNMKPEKKYYIAQL